MVYSVHSVIIKRTVPLKEARKHAEHILKRKGVMVIKDPTTFRFENVPTHKFVPSTLRTKKINDVISLLVGKLKPSIFGKGVSREPPILSSTEHKAMSDGDIRHFDPNARIVIYRNLPNTTIEELLPEESSHIYLLYESSPNSGHWTTINRDKKGFNYFDSYGHKPDFPIQWSPPELRAQFGEDYPHLSEMLSKATLPVHYNNCDYQSHDDGMSTCGRHSCFYTKAMMGGLTLEDYKTMMDKIEKEEGLSPDAIVSKYVSC